MFNLLHLHHHLQKNLMEKLKLFFQVSLSFYFQKQLLFTFFFALLPFYLNTFDLYFLRFSPYLLLFHLTRFIEFLSSHQGLLTFNNKIMPIISYHCYLVFNLFLNPPIKNISHLICFNLFVIRLSCFLIFYLTFKLFLKRFNILRLPLWFFLFEKL